MNPESSKKEKRSQHLVTWIIAADVSFLTLAICCGLIVVLSLYVYNYDVDIESLLFDNPVFWLGCTLATSAGLFGSISIIVHVVRSTSKRILPRWLFWVTVICFFNPIILALFYAFYLRRCLKTYFVQVPNGRREN